MSILFDVTTIVKSEELNLKKQFSKSFIFNV